MSLRKTFILIMSIVCGLIFAAEFGLWLSDASTFSSWCGWLCAAINAGLYCSEIKE